MCRSWRRSIVGAGVACSARRSGVVPTSGRSPFSLLRSRFPVSRSCMIRAHGHALDQWQECHLSSDSCHRARRRSARTASGRRPRPPGCPGAGSRRARPISSATAAIPGTRSASWRRRPGRSPRRWGSTSSHRTGSTCFGTPTPWSCPALICTTGSRPRSSRCSATQYERRRAHPVDLHRRVCVLAHAGLLDGKRATTHWHRRAGVVGTVPARDRRPGRPLRRRRPGPHQRRHRRGSRPVPPRHPRRSRRRGSRPGSPAGPSSRRTAMAVRRSTSTVPSSTRRPAW